MPRKRLRPTPKLKAVPETMERDHLNLLCNVNELSSLLAGSADVDTFLQRTVDMVADHIRADVCSIYMFTESRGELYLRATHGLNPDKVNEVRLGLGEGLVGLCLESRRPVCEQKASENPHFKAVKGLDEEKYESFLAVPIQRGSERIGVLVAQRREEDNFNESDVLALQATASQLAGMIENARILLSFHEQAETGPANGDEMILIRGQTAVEGYAMAPLMVYGRSRANWRKPTPVEDSRAYGLEEFEHALQATEEQIEGLQAQLENKLPEVAAMIFGAHLMILRDPEFAGAMQTRIGDGVNAPAAVRQVATNFIDIFQRSPNAYIREKVSDVEDLAGRLIANLVNTDTDPRPECQGKIVIAPDLYPSELLKLASGGAVGFIVASGGVTSHIAILGRSLQLPTIITNDQKLLELAPDTPLLLDADIGNIYVRPTEEVVASFAERNRRRHETPREKLHGETRLQSGERIRLTANINLLSDVNLARELNAEGVGLYRSEFPFLIRADFPSEAEQVNIYHYLIEQMDGREVTMRTLDIGGDKVAGYFPGHLPEDNPALGMRSIRFSLRYPDIFREQLRAILRAGAGHRNLRLMFPMISSLDEFIRARGMYDACCEELAAEGVPFADDMQVGMMVEIPSVVPVMHDFAKVSDFFCIGTNDFTQFMLAVDRGNERVADYFKPHHPAVLRSLKQVVDAALAHNRDVSICGELAHEPLFIPFLIGIGMPTLSVDAHFLPRLQRQIRRLDMSTCRAHADAVLDKGTTAEVWDLLTTMAPAED